MGGCDGSACMAGFPSWDHKCVTFHLEGHRRPLNATRGCLGPSRPFVRLLFSELKIPENLEKLDPECARLKVHFTSALSQLGIRVGRFPRIGDDAGNEEVPHEQEVCRSVDGPGTG